MRIRNAKQRGVADTVKSNVAVPVPKAKLNRWVRIFFYSIGACFVWFGISYFFGPEQWKWTSDSSIIQTAAGKSQAAFAKNAIPTAAQYRDMAKKNGWTPVDPVKKLNDALMKMPMVFDLEEAAVNKDPDSLLQLLHEEVVFLVKVLSKSIDERFDLSESIHVALEAMHQSLFRIMKKRLQLRDPRALSKAQAEQLTRHWLGNNMRELLTLVVRKLHHNDDLISHLILDLNAVNSATGLDLLTRAVQLRIYSAIAAIASLSLDPKAPVTSTSIVSLILRIQRPLTMAVRNADDLAIALLLQVLSQQHPFSSVYVPDSADATVLQIECVAVLEACIEARELRYDALYDRLTQHLARRFCQNQLLQTDLDEESGINMPLANSSQQFLRNEIPHWLSLNPKWNQSLELSAVSFPISHNNPFSNLNETVNISLDSINSRESVRWCDLPILTLSQLLEPVAVTKRNDVGLFDHASDDTVVTRFERDFLTRNVPVLIDVNPSKRIEDQTHWDQLQSVFDAVFNDQSSSSSKKARRLVKVAAIPYAPLFGLSEVDTTLMEFSASYIPRISQITRSYRNKLLDIMRESSISHSRGSQSDKDLYQLTAEISAAVRDFHYSFDKVHADKDDTPIPVNLLKQIVQNHQQQQNDNDYREGDKDNQHKANSQLPEQWPLYFFGAVTHLANQNNSESVSGGITAIRQGETHWLKEKILPSILSYLQHPSPATEGVDLDGYQTSTTTQIQSLWDLISSVSPASNSSRAYRLQVFHGPALSGAPLHSHSPAFNLAVRGNKLWTLLPPAADMYSSIHPIETIQHYHYDGLSQAANDKDNSVDPNLDPNTHKLNEHMGKLGCIALQKSGYALYVPRHVSHSVVNLDDINSGFALEVEQYVH